MRKKLLVAAAVVALLGLVFILVLWNRMQNDTATAQAGAAGGDAPKPATGGGKKNDDGKATSKKAGGLAARLSAPSAASKAAGDQAASAAGSGSKSTTSGSAWGDAADNTPVQPAREPTTGWAERFKSAWAEPAEKGEGGAGASDDAAGAATGKSGDGETPQQGAKKSWADLAAESRVNEAAKDAAPPRRSIFDVGDDEGEADVAKRGVAAEASDRGDDSPRRPPTKSGAAGAFPIDDEGASTGASAHDDRDAATDSGAAVAPKKAAPSPAAATATDSRDDAPISAERFPTATIGPRYIARSDDSFWLIAKRLYGSGDYYEALYEHNRQRHRGIADLKEGDLVETPSIEELRRLYPDLCPAPIEKSAPPVHIADSHPPPTERTTVPDRWEWHPKARVPNEAASDAAATDDKTSIGEPRAADPMPTPTSRALDKPAAGGFTAIAGQRHYVVAKGDTLFGIARRTLGKATRWVEIYELNRDLLGDDVDLRPGLELRLPDDVVRDNSAAQQGAAGPPR